MRFVSHHGDIRQFFYPDWNGKASSHGGRRSTRSLSLRQIRAHRERERRAKNKSRRRRRRRREWFMRSKLFVVLSFKTRLYSYSFDHRKSHATKSCSFCVGRETSMILLVLKNKGNKKDPPPPPKTPPFLPLNLLTHSRNKKELCVAFECVGRRRRRGERGGGGRRAGSGRLFFLVLISRGALFALHRPKPRGVNERRDRRERKNCWSSRVQREIALKFITTTTTTTTARSKRVTTTRCCHYPC